MVMNRGRGEIVIEWVKRENSQMIDEEEDAAIAQIWIEIADDDDAFAVQLVDPHPKSTSDA